ncbi:hypothetical protein JHK85_045498 [Glycine max]|nr:hypothetical protein JHK86_044883 [Glycine max]KAG4951631.1 hypothetical protein JHK85_045498 [Glycine max]
MPRVSTLLSEEEVNQALEEFKKEEELVFHLQCCKWIAEQTHANHQRRTEEVSCEVELMQAVRVNMLSCQGDMVNQLDKHAIKGADNSTLYGCCLLVEELVQKV